MIRPTPNPMLQIRTSEWLAQLKRPSGLFLVILTAYVLFTRLWNLDLKPVQHDESMFAYYSYQIFKNGTEPPRNLAAAPRFDRFVESCYGFLGNRGAWAPGFVFFVLAALMAFYFRRKGATWPASSLIACLWASLATALFVFLEILVFWLRARAGYGYMPILHGPVLEWATAAVFKIFGDSNATMRLFPALCGITIFVMLFLMRERLGRRALYLALLFLALSPTVTFFSRYNRSDIIFLCAATLIIYAGWRYAKTERPLWLMGLLLLCAYAVSIMETYVIFFFLCATFGLGCWIHGFVKAKPYHEIPFYRDLWRAVTRHAWALVLGIALALLLIVTLFTSFFKFKEHTNGVWEAIVYWTGEHAKHRIKGPFHFHLIHMAIYELPFLIYWVFAIVAQMWPRQGGAWAWTWARRLLFVHWLALSSLILLLPTSQRVPGGQDVVPVWKYAFSEKFESLTHISMGFHVWMVFQLFIVVGITGWRHLNRGRVFHAFVDYWAAGSFLAYSYAGEKVPWVGMHVVIPMLISCAMYLDLGMGTPTAAEAEAAKPPPRAPVPPARQKKGRDVRRTPEARVKKKPPPREEPGSLQPVSAARATLRWTGIVLGLLGLAWELWLANFLVFKNSGSPIERHTYASSHMEFKKAFDRIEKEAREKYQGRDTPVAHQGEPSWPLVWLLRHYTKITAASIPANTDARYVFIDNLIHDGFAYILEGGAYVLKPVPKPPYLDRYDWQKVRFRHYWQPIPLDWKAMKRFWLLWADPAKLSEQDRQKAKTTRIMWGKLWTAMIKRDENIRGDYRWDHLGGYDAYIGTLREPGAPEPQKLPDQLRPLKAGTP